MRSNPVEAADELADLREMCARAELIRSQLDSGRSTMCYGMHFAAEVILGEHPVSWVKTMLPPMTPEERAWLDGLPRRTLHERVEYWRVRDELEARGIQAARVRPYVLKDTIRKIASAWFE